MANTHGTRSPEEIEREIEVERSQLTGTLEEIQDRLSFEALSADLVNTVRGQTGDIGRAVTRSLKENPMAVALTAVGVAWMILGPVRRGRSGYASSYDDDYDEFDDDYGDEATFSSNPRSRVMGSRYGAGGMSPRPPARSLYTADQDWDESYGEDDDGGEGRWDRARTFFSDKRDAASERASRAGSSIGGAASSATGSVSSGAGSAASAASSAAHSAADSVRSGASSAAGGVRSGYESAASGVRGGYRAAASRIGGGYASARSGAQHAGQKAYASARDLAARISEGTEGLSEEARRRVIAARQRAYEAQVRTEYYARRGREKASDLYEDQPLVMGALALAVGAAIGGILPRTGREDEAFGSYRDDLFDEAERIYREEREKITAVAQATADEARAAVKEFGETMKEDAKMVAEDAEEKAREAAQRVADRARTEADDKGVGKV